jgi:hypothetical protein
MHPFVKLTITYVGIMTGFAVLGWVFYEIGAREGPAIVSVPPFVPSGVYLLLSIGYFATLTVLSLTGLFALAKNLRPGAYLAFAALIIALFAPYAKITGTPPFTIIWWFAIPNTV